MYQQAKSFGTTPAALLGIENDWIGWQFNGAILYYGSYVETELSYRDKNNKPKRTLQDVFENGGMNGGARRATAEDYQRLLNGG